MQRKPEAPVHDRPLDGLVSEAALADHWDVSKRTLQRWRRSGEGPAYVMIGASVRYRVADIRDYEDRTRRNAEASQ